MSTLTKDQIRYQKRKNDPIYRKQLKAAYDKWAKTDAGKTSRKQNKNKWQVTQEYKDKRKLYMTKKREWFKAYKSNCKCNQCSESDPVCLDFHHVDPSTKLFEIGAGVSHRSLTNLQRELAKCVPLCRNCHAKLHARR